MSIQHISSCLLVFFVAAIFITPGQTEENELSDLKQRRAGPWSLNSIGYNAGLQGLRKFFHKRDEFLSGIGLDTDPSTESEFNTAIINDFMEFVRMKVENLSYEGSWYSSSHTAFDIESGLFGPELLRCLMNRARTNDEEK